MKKDTSYSFRLKKGTESIWFPEKERRDMTSVGFEVVDEEA